MARLTPLSLEQAQRLGQSFGLDVISVEALDLGSVNSNFRLLTNDGRKWFARIYEEQGLDGARAELLLLRELAAQGVPLTLPCAQLAGGDVATLSGKAVSVYHWVEGVHLCNAMVTEQRTRTLGEALAAVHLATAKLSVIPEGRFGADGIRRRLEELEGEGARFNDVVSFLRSKLEHYVGLRSVEVPRGLIHGDLFRDNVLWQGDELVALLDFESASRGAFVYDIAVCLLSWCYSDALRVDCARALLAGYESRRPLSALEKQELATEGAIACTRFATTRIRDFSLRCPPGQEPERDYRRFLQRLNDIENGAFAPLLVP